MRKIGKAERLTTGDGRPATVYTGMSGQQLMQLISTGQWTSVRWLVDNHGGFWIWDAYDLTHDDVSYQLGIDYAVSGNVLWERGHPADGVSTKWYPAHNIDPKQSRNFMRLFSDPAIPLVDPEYDGQMEHLSPADIGRTNTGSNLSTRNVLQP